MKRLGTISNAGCGAGALNVDWMWLCSDLLIYLINFRFVFC